MTKAKTELFHAELAIGIAIALQALVNTKLTFGPKFTMIVLEIVLAVGLLLVNLSSHSLTRALRRFFAYIFISIVTLANISSLVLVSRDLVVGTTLPGKTLLFAAVSIFLTNIIMFGLWYWEIDSPGLTGHFKEDAKAHFLFPQMEMKHIIEQWRPTFFDYLYVSVTNASAFSPTDVMPLTHRVKALMGAQSVVSLLTVALVTARAVNILS
jgi:uncharacterized membrane protein